MTRKFILPFFGSVLYDFLMKNWVAWCGMATADPTDTLAALERLREEVTSLTEQQSEALKDAIYLGMTPAQAQAYDERRKQITRLMQEISLLQQAH